MHYNQIYFVNCFLLCKAEYPDPGESHQDPNIWIQKKHTRIRISGFRRGTTSIEYPDPEEAQHDHIIRIHKKTTGSYVITGSITRTTGSGYPDPDETQTGPEYLDPEDAQQAIP